MPIYEFKCTKCEEYFEILVTPGEQEVEMACPACKSEEFERILSTTNYAMGGGKGGGGMKTENRQCSSGSCTTYELPGMKR